MIEGWATRPSGHSAVPDHGRERTHVGRHRQCIVVTGGPGGGKTTALDLFQRELKTAVTIVTEAATLLFGHGLDRDHGAGKLKILQRSIYRMQVSLEEIFRDFYPDRLLICDRGTLDWLAYLKDRTVNGTSTSIEGLKSLRSASAGARGEP
ncbi:MAG: AAA family ATPase, partial [Planctomycetia bacterium]